MNPNVISVSPEMPLLEAAKIIAEHKFDGVPVVTTDNVLVGILTEYDLISKGSSVHLPTLHTILQNLSVFQKDQSHFKKEVENIASLRVKDVMNSDPLILSDEATLEEVVQAFREHHRVNPIPVVDKEHNVVGVVSRFDVLKPFGLVQSLNN